MALEQPRFFIHFNPLAIGCGVLENRLQEKEIQTVARQELYSLPKKLVKFWVDHMEIGGRVIRLYPLLGITQSLLNKEVSELRCGSG